MTFTHISRNALNMKVDPQMEVSGSQLMVVFSLLTESISLLHFSLPFAFLQSPFLFPSIFPAHTSGLLVTPIGTHRHCTPLNRAGVG